MLSTTARDCGLSPRLEDAHPDCNVCRFVTMFVYKELRWRDRPGLVHRTLKTVAMVMTLIACASAFGYVMALMQLPAKITQFFLSLSHNADVILMMINVLLLVLGCLMDMAPLILICTPIMLPVVTTLGVDPVHFGMIMLLNLGIGLLTPPVGATLFVGCAVGKVTMEQVMRNIWPFYGVLFAVLMLVTYVPSVSLWLPRLLKL
jgi:tripartite ATP-independent transporter DctM subunit